MVQKEITDWEVRIRLWANLAKWRGCETTTRVSPQKRAARPYINRIQVAKRPEAAAIGSSQVCIFEKHPGRASEKKGRLL